MAVLQVLAEVAGTGSTAGNPGPSRLCLSRRR
jgi:hypothetical protein